MHREISAADPIEAVSVLGEPTRRRLYEYVATRHEAVGRDEAAAAVGIGRPLAAFHLDRLVEAGLLDVEFRRLSGRSGPGAGRPAKLYRRAREEVEVALPDRRYELAARLFATGLEAGGGPETSAMRGVLDAARALGERLGAAEPSQGGDPGDREGGRAALLDVLREGGFEPESEADGKTIRLRNCPFDALAKSHRATTCSMNLALLEGLAGSLPPSGLEPHLEVEDGYCCVAFRPSPH